ncbi:helix-hairpin-helix domain-containing protein [Nocardioides sp. zg-1228]|uniref:ComEA family DNA-binding protein n=1 Tax=Nocardioides sp. zg-1228 TaxID=2763008 RepID=UPI001642A32D|nr:helix-hairpin-helix domain-containing protein [Nocardioides sp. zg-1228]MBC2931511.1 helix-hairpin-helix domain-containing protein [Nocardioides sp. zg-1228]QSF57115.1 helix-hairpin-helix domain-containing protein [Nocardioides sp. zg-1228]
MQPSPPAGPYGGEHMRPGPPAVHHSRKPLRWLWVFPAFSMGLLAVVPLIAIATKSRTRQAWTWAGGLGASWLVGFMLVAADDSDGLGSDIGLTLYFAAWIGSVVYALVMGGKVAGPAQVSYVPVAAPLPSYDPNAAAVALVQAERAKREEARALARRDPAMARDLRIGRPDLPRQYDDGGLVDVNSAPAEVLQQSLGLTADQATGVVESRQQLSRFEHPEDLMTLAGLEPAAFDSVKDRIILL